MSYFIDKCLICLQNANNLKIITSQDTNGTSIEDKLRYFLPELGLKTNIPRNICVKCENDLDNGYKFKQKCLQNITTYENYAQQITTIDSSSDVISYDFVCVKEEISYEKNYDANASESQTKINLDTANSDELIVKEETNEKLVLDKELKLILRDVKEEISHTSDRCNKNSEISNNSASFPTSNKNINEQDNKASKNENAPKYHKKVHICRVCSKLFKKICDLKRHELIHTNTRPYTCEICKYSFRQLHHLERHRLRHTGEKPYSCEVCNRSFTRSLHLKQHRVIHTGEKPFTCEVCDESFGRLYTFKQHKQIHTDEEGFTRKASSH